jgi:hypothetical protein
MILKDYVRRIGYLARKNGVSAYLPLHLGGAGLFPPKGNSVLTQNEEAWLRALETGDADAAKRLRMVRNGDTKLFKFDGSKPFDFNNRSFRRTALVTQHIVYSNTGPGLSPKILGLIGRYRAFNDDLSAAEGRGTPEDISPRIYFKALGAFKYKGDRPPLDFRRYANCYNLDLVEDTSKFSVTDMLTLIKYSLPNPVLVEVLLKEQDDFASPYSEDGGD